MIVPWGRERCALGLNDVEGGFMTGRADDRRRKEDHAKRVFNGSLLRQSGSRTSLGISGSQTSLCCGDYATEGIEAVEAVDAHAHEKLLDYYAGGDYSQLTSLPRRTPSEAVPARPTTLEFLDLIVEGCATQWIDLRRAFKKFENRNTGHVTADDFGIVFRRAFSVYLAPEEADALVAMFAGETAVRVTFAQFAAVVTREMSRGYKLRRDGRSS